MSEDLEKLMEGFKNLPPIHPHLFDPPFPSTEYDDDYLDKYKTPDILPNYQSQEFLVDEKIFWSLINKFPTSGLGPKAFQKLCSRLFAHAAAQDPGYAAIREKLSTGLECSATMADFPGVDLTHDSPYQNKSAKERLYICAAVIGLLVRLKSKPSEQAKARWRHLCSHFIWRRFGFPVEYKEIEFDNFKSFCFFAEPSAYTASIVKTMIFFEQYAADSKFFELCSYCTLQAIEYNGLHFWTSARKVAEILEPPTLYAVENVLFHPYILCVEGFAALYDLEERLSKLPSNELRFKYCRFFDSQMCANYGWKHYAQLYVRFCYVLQLQTNDAAYDRFLQQHPSSVVNLHPFEKEEIKRKVDFWLALTEAEKAEFSQTRPKIVK